MTYLLLFAVGFVSGTLNVVAGGGSFLTLPVLIFLGLPSSMANGTNRVAIFIQNIFAITLDCIDIHRQFVFHHTIIISLVVVDCIPLYHLNRIRPNEDIYFFHWA